MKTKIYKNNNSNSHVTLEYYDEVFDRVIEVDFSCPNSGGYVRFSSSVRELGITGGNQVCDHLARLGDTLYSYNGDLLPIIRREWVRMRQQSKYYDNPITL